MSTTIQKKQWTTGNGRLIFEFIPQIDAQDEILSVVVSVYWRDRPQDILREVLVPHKITDLNHQFETGQALTGYINLVVIGPEQNEPDQGIWGDFYYGTHNEHHFEGVMLEFTEPSSVQPNPPIPPIPPIPLEPLADGKICDALIAPSDQEGDLFPYIYMRRWPTISAAELEMGFIQYQPHSKEPKQNSLYEQLVVIKKANPSDAREQMALLAANFIDSEGSFAEPFLMDTGQLSGPIRYFAEIDGYVRSVPEIEQEQLLQAIERIVNLERDEIQTYVQGVDYHQDKERVWQSYFALIIRLGYRSDLVEGFTRVLAMAHLVEVLIEEGRDELTPQQLARLAYATILLPASLFPLPPMHESASQGSGIPRESDKPEAGKASVAEKVNGVDMPAIDVGWLEPYAIGDLQIVRQRLVRYEAGQIAHIENILQGERREITKRKRNQVIESVATTKEFDKLLENDALELSTDFLNETLKTVADTLTTTSYKNFKTSYGPPTTATLDGEWSVEAQPGKSAIPATEHISRFARNILNKTANRIAQHVHEMRQVSTIDETEETVVSIFDNTGQAHNLQGIYRWLNKVYQARVITYGNRLLIEFMLKAPAARYIQYQAETLGRSYSVPLDPTERQIFTYQDVKPENYAKLAAQYDVREIQPPPLEARTVSSILQGEEVKQIGIPSGYMAQEAIIAYTVPNTQLPTTLEGMIGTHPFNFSQPQSSPTRFPMDHEDETVPIALMVDGGNDKSPARRNNVLVTVELKCIPTDRAMDEWRIRTYNAIINGFHAQQQAYAQKVDTARNGRIADRSQRAIRQTERQELRRGCERLLLERFFKKAGAVSSLLTPTIPSQFSVNEPRYREFFEHAFEWHEMLYRFYTDLDENNKPNPSWHHLYETAGCDDLFASFLNADLARVIVPVKPNHLLTLLYYLSSGMIWSGDDALAPANMSDVEIINEIRKAEDQDNSASNEQEPWEVVVPTNMQVLGSIDV